MSYGKEPRITMSKTETMCGETGAWINVNEKILWDPKFEKAYKVGTERYKEFLEFRS